VIHSVIYNNVYLNCLRSIYSVFQGNEVIEGIFLDTTKLTFDVNPMAFENMYNLRLLKIYSTHSETAQELRLTKELRSLPYELRLLHWEKYPLQSLPQDFDTRHLVELNMPYSQLQSLCVGTKVKVTFRENRKLFFFLVKLFMCFVLFCRA